MTRRTQRFLFLGVAILVVGLGTGLVASYVGFPNLGITSDEPAELAYVPVDATAVAFANVREVMDSEVRQKLIQQVAPGDGADQFEAETGINIQTDVDRLVASISGSPDPSNPAARNRSRSPYMACAVTASTGMAAVRSSERNRPRACTPSTSGS